MAYVIVQFDECEGGGLAIVRDNWITPRKGEVFWPPYKKTLQYNKALKCGESVDEKWQIYKISRCFYSCDDYDKVHQKLKECEVHSDIQSDSEQNRVKRRRVPSRKFITDDSDNSDSCGESILPKPPKVKRVLNCSISETGQRDQTLHHRTIVSEDISESSLAYNKNHVIEQSVWQEKIFRSLEEIKEQNKQILASLKTTQSNTALLTTFDIPKLPVEIPVSTVEQLNILEEALKNKQLSASLCNYLSTVGGRDVTNKTNRILKALLMDNTASNFNYMGKRSEKRAFCHLTLKDVIIGAVKTTDKSVTDKQVEDLIKIWLKHAPERIKLNNARKNKENV